MLQNIIFPRGITIGRYRRRTCGKKVRWTCIVMMQK
nr:MAG TPA: hypothetical protein [Bacteriophage sp.]